jgi:hypothetical protein
MSVADALLLLAGRIDGFERDIHLDQLLAAVDGVGGHGRGMGWLRIG